MAKSAAPSELPTTNRWTAFFRKAERPAAYAVATVGGSGYFPIASGTAGTLVTALAIWGLGPVSLWVQITVIVLLFAAGVWSAGIVAHGREDHDASCIVIDEAVGLWITMLAMPRSPYWLLCGFFLFRFFDIGKLWPANYFDQRWNNRWGVILDDVISGIYANIWMQLLWHFSFGSLTGPLR